MVIVQKAAIIQASQILPITEALLDNVIGYLIEQMEVGLQISMYLHAYTYKLWVHSVKDGCDIISRVSDPPGKM